jgi:all-trans-retinol 13,14-reductase
MAHSSYVRDTGPDTADAIVIGSGIGGLTTAALLGTTLGKRVIVLERHYTPGGFTHTFKRPGYEWDVGVHYVGDATNPDRGMGAMLREVTDGSLQWSSMGDVYDTVVIAGRPYEYLAGADAWRERMIDHFPDQRQAIESYGRLVRQAVTSSTGYWAEKVVPPAIAMLAGWGLRRRFLTHARQTTRQVLERLTSNQELIAVLTAQWGDYGLPPARSSFAMHAVLTDHYRNGGFYPVGGAARIAAAMMPGIEASGGRVLVNAEVATVNVVRGRAVGVTMADGRRLTAPIVVSDAGLATTVRLLPADAPGRTALGAILSRVRPSAAHLCLYIGLRGTAEAIGLPKTNYWIYPGPDFEGGLARFERDPSAPLPLSFISFPSAKDPSFARRHPGRATIEVVTIAPYDWFERWATERWRRRGEDYERLKAQLTTRLLDSLYEVAPQVRGQVDVAELSTPLSTRHFANYARGEIYGLEHSPARFAERGLKPHTPVRGLFLTGQDVCTCGVGGALAGGYLSASAIAGRPLFPRSARA